MKRALMLLVVVAGLVSLFTWGVFALAWLCNVFGLTVKYGIGPEIFAWQVVMTLTLFICGLIDRYAAVRAARAHTDQAQ